MEWGLCDYDQYRIEKIIDLVNLKGEYVIYQGTDDNPIDPTFSFFGKKFDKIRQMSLNSQISFKRESLGCDCTTLIGCDCQWLPMKFTFTKIKKK